MQFKSMQFEDSELYKEGIKQLIEAKVATPQLDARILLAHDKDRFEENIRRRKNREPISHIIGKREFWKDEFKVTKDTLDPRPDSETIIEAALKEFPGTEQMLEILDLGTGTGCLLISLLREFSTSYGIGLDISPQALMLAEENAANIGVSNRVSFIKSDLLQGSWHHDFQEGFQINRKICWEDHKKSQIKFDLIISNPPYIKTNEINKLEPEVVFYEPFLALDGGHDGLCFYKAIITGLQKLLAKNGRVILEIGANQATDVKSLILNNNLKVIQIIKDLAGNDRCVVAGL